MGQLTNNRRKRVFLSYATEDRAVSRQIGEQFEKARFDVGYTERELLPGDSIVEKIGKAVSSSDYVFLLVSKNFLNYESGLSMAYLDELTTRNVAIIPVLIDNCEVPVFLLKYQIFDLRKKTDKNIRKLVNQITSAPRIDFSFFTQYDFVKLVADLLTKLHFRKIEVEQGVADRHIDLTAEYTQKDPFGVRKKEVWIVETKFYRSERASLKSLREMMGSLVIFPNAKLLLITNGLLTSYVQKWLRDFQWTGGRYIRVIEGPELRRLLLRFPDLVDLYFPATSQRIIDAN